MESLIEASPVKLDCVFEIIRNCFVADELEGYDLITRALMLLSGNVRD